MYCRNIIDNRTYSIKNLKRFKITVTGIVQGVGFRPFVYREAVKRNLDGYVRNSTKGVEIEVEGSSTSVNDLVDTITNHFPPNARVDNLSIDEIDCNGDSNFNILHSIKKKESVTFITPDLATCNDCIQELFDLDNRRYEYPFINCTNCGPRFSIIKELPYDRQYTTMDEFQYCSLCSDEYHDPHDRRYHAEPIACDTCGPKVSLIDSSGQILADNENSFYISRNLLLKGKIIAVKGLGGFHLACDAKNDETVQSLRKRKNRPHKPMAIMCANLSTVYKYFEISPREVDELTSSKRPILLLKLRNNPSGTGKTLSQFLAPNHSFIGVMLPYTPLHHLLFENGIPEALVMTSGNQTDEPIIKENSDALVALRDIADAFLIHDRPIQNRCDDSVGYIDGERTVLLRRSKGYAPLPIYSIKKTRPILALGSMLNNVFALSKGNQIFLSQHIGNVNNLKTLDFLKKTIYKFIDWFDIEPEIIVHDLHPDLLTTHLANNLSKNCTGFGVQHHFAHLASIIAANNIKEKVQGLVLDGTGWGPDGSIWGGELLVGSEDSFKRVGHMKYLPLPGGEASIKKPIRIAAAYLKTLFPESLDFPLEIWNHLSPYEREIIFKMVDNNFNTPMTSSAGRLFDAVASILGVRHEISYEGQAAIELEQLAYKNGSHQNYKLQFDLFEEDGMFIFDPKSLLANLVEQLTKDTDKAALAHQFHISFGSILAKASGIIYQRGGPKYVALCGGVFQNRLLTNITSEKLKEQNLIPILPGIIPVNDAGISLGQILIANSAFFHNPKNSQSDY
ncbi:carbamoyltransferase HypF [bacterium]|nr:carbamoyltransferase HypF [bacterium]